MSHTRTGARTPCFKLSNAAVRPHDLYGVPFAPYSQINLPTFRATFVLRKASGWTHGKSADPCCRPWQKTPVRSRRSSATSSAGKPVVGPKVNHPRGSLRRGKEEPRAPRGASIQRGTILARTTPIRRRGARGRSVWPGRVRAPRFRDEDWNRAAKGGRVGGLGDGKARKRRSACRVAAFVCSCVLGSRRAVRGGEDLPGLGAVGSRTGLANEVGECAYKVQGLVVVSSRRAIDSLSSEVAQGCCR